MFHINCLCFSQRACNFLDKMHHRLQTKLWWLKHSRLPFDAIDAKKLKRERIFSFFRSSQQILLLFFASCALYFYQAVATYTFFSSLFRSALALKTVHNSSYKRIQMCVFRLCIICIVFCTVEMSSMFRHFSRLAFDYIFFSRCFVFFLYISHSLAFSKRSLFWICATRNARLSTEFNYVCRWSRNNNNNNNWEAKKDANAWAMLGFPE